MSKSFNVTCAPARSSIARRVAPAYCCCVRKALGRRRSPNVWGVGATRSGASKNGIEPNNWMRFKTDPGRDARAFFPPLLRTRIVALACRKPAELGLPLVRWSVRTLTLQIIHDGIVTEIHYSSVCLILQAADLKPHRTVYWKMGHDPEFVPKAVHVLWYYENARRLAAQGEPVFCLDEKPGIQLLGRPHPDESIRTGHPLKRDFEYVRHGVGLLWMVVNLVTGVFFTRSPERKNSLQLTALLDEHLQTLPAAKRVHYILDNDSTHTSACTRDWLKSKDGRVQFHHTPKYASWLNQAEIGLGNFSKYYLNGRVWKSKDDFPPHVETSTQHYNQTFAHPFDWSFTRNRFHEWRSSKTFSTEP